MSPGSVAANQTPMIIDSMPAGATFEISAKTDFFLLIAGVAALAGAAMWSISGWVSSVLDAKGQM
jgi:hypothetical protein